MIFIGKIDCWHQLLLRSYEFFVFFCTGQQNLVKTNFLGSLLVDRYEQISSLKNTEEILFRLLKNLCYFYQCGTVGIEGINTKLPNELRSSANCRLFFWQIKLVPYMLHMQYCKAFVNFDWKWYLQISWLHKYIHFDRKRIPYLIYPNIQENKKNSQLPLTSGSNMVSP